MEQANLAPAWLTILMRRVSVRHASTNVCKHSACADLSEDGGRELWPGGSPVQMNEPGVPGWCNWLSSIRLWLRS